MRAQGVGGELRHGYAVAVRIRSWILEPDKEGADHHAVRITVDHVDPYFVKQRPLQLVLQLGPLSWTWDDALLEQDWRVTIRGAPVEGVKVLHG